MATRSILARVAGGLGLLLVLYAVAVAAWQRFPLSQTEVEAIARLESAGVPPVQRDAGELLWVASHDVPETQRAQVARATVAFLAARPHVDAALSLPGSPLGRYPKFADPPEAGDGVCDQDALDCLAYVRRDAARVARTLAAHEREIALGAMIREYDGFRYPLTPDIHNAIPPYGVHRRLVLTRLAQQFVQGRQVDALAGTCSDLAAWRRMSGGTDTLIGNMISTAFVRQDAVLLSQMVSELPADAPLPRACDEALAPTRDSELDNCPAMRYEYAHLRSALFEQGVYDPGSPSGRLVGAWIDKRRMASRMARAFSQYCGTAALENARNDRPAPKHGQSVRCGVVPKILDPLGCVLSEIQAASNYTGYFDRRTDVAAAIALLRSADWLGRQPGTVAERRALLARRPASLGLRRTPTLSDDGRSISFALLQPWKGDRITMPVRAPAPAAAD